ncbi:MAG: FecR domain-containing protein [Leptospiraceae bacterium]|nr:FecR domain-containing protein [Leptospiraceae bacterium]
MLRKMFLFLFFFGFSTLWAKDVAVILFAKGKVYVNETRRVRIGDKISDRDILTTQIRSSCELQFLNSESPVVVRLKENTSFKLNENSGKYRVEVKSGRAMFNVDKLKAGSLEVISPTSVAGVRGTKFEVEAPSNGDNKIVTLEGEVSSRLRVQEIENPDTNPASQDPKLKGIIDSLERNKVSVKKGGYLDVSKKTSQEYYKEEDASSSSQKALQVNKLDDRVYIKKHEIYDELIPINLNFIKDLERFQSILTERNKERKHLGLINSLKRELREEREKNKQAEQRYDRIESTLVKERTETGKKLELLNSEIDTLKRKRETVKASDENGRKIKDSLQEFSKKLKKLEKSLEEVKKNIDKN